jgi:hypothetical protein
MRARGMNEKYELEEARIMSITKKQLKRIIRETLFIEANTFAATAQEEAEKINSQTGAGYVTDQSFWEERGIVTGEDLALSVLSQTYSDMYKDINGIRPRWVKFTSADEASRKIDTLHKEYESAMEDQQFAEEEIQRHLEKEKEIQTLMPGEFDYEHIPRSSGMGRRVENKMRITKRQLRRIIKEEKLKLHEVQDTETVEMVKDAILELFVMHGEVRTIDVFDHLRMNGFEDKTINEALDLLAQEY